MSKTFLFSQKNGSGNLTLSAPNYEEALQELEKLVLYPYDWRVEDEEAEDNE